MEGWLIFVLVLLSLAAAASLGVGIYFGIDKDAVPKESIQQAQALDGSCARVRDFFRQRGAGMQKALCWIDRSTKSEGNCDLLYREVSGDPNITPQDKKKVTDWRLSCGL